MSINSIVTEQDLNNLGKLAEQQKEQRALKIKNRILKQTHDIKLAESLSPVTKTLDEVKESTEKLRDVIKESQPKTPQLALENTPAPQPIKNNEGMIYDIELEITLKNMENIHGFFKTHHDPQLGWMLNKNPTEISSGTKVKINDKEYNITPGIQKVIVDSTYDTAKSMNDTENLVFRDILQKTDYYKRKPSKGRMSGRDRHIKNDLDNNVRKILNLDTKFKGRGVEKNIIPFNIIDIYNRLEVLLGLKISGHTDTLAEASNLIVELYERGEIQKKYRNALNKFQT